MRGTVLSTLSVLLLSACAAADAGPGPAAAEYEPTEAERAEILATLQVVFDALESGDAEMLRSVVAPDVVMYSAGVDAAGTTRTGSSTLEALATRIETSEVPQIERMWDPEVRVHGPIASIWTPYDFYAGTTFSHCGIDAATLLKGDDGWRLVALSWTRLQPPSCPPHPEGPPSG